jgi:hypothetical protein
MSRASNSSDGISLYCSREMLDSESNNGFHSFNGNGGLGNGVSYRRASNNDLDMVDEDDTGKIVYKYLGLYYPIINYNFVTEYHLQRVFFKFQIMKKTMKIVFSVYGPSQMNGANCLTNMIQKVLVRSHWKILVRLWIVVISFRPSHQES